MNDKVVIGFGAASLTNRRKGFRDLQLAMAKLRDTRQVMGLVFGEQQLDASDDALPKMKTVGYVTDEERQAQAYSAMDFFVLPSWAENMPQTAVEAMACGIPVVAYDVGGVPEIITSDDIGYTVVAEDPTALADGIKRALARDWDSEKLCEVARARTWDNVAISSRVRLVFRDGSTGINPSPVQGASKSTTSA